MYIKLYLIWPDPRFLSINTSMILPGDFYIINFTAENKVQIIIIIISLSVKINNIFSVIWKSKNKRWN